MHPLLRLIVVGIPAGLLSAAFRNSWIDHAARLVTLVSLSLPSFWLGLMLIILFSLKLDLLPIVGYEPITKDFWGGLRFLILPGAALGTYLAALLTRLTRSSMLEVLGQDYVRTARAKGLRDTVVLMPGSRLDRFAASSALEGSVHGVATLRSNASA